MSQTLAKIGDLGEQVGLLSNTTFHNASEIEAPNSVIESLLGGARRIPDFANMMTPILGVETVLITNVREVEDEFGPEGRVIYSLDNADPRIRFGGPLTTNGVFGGNEIIRGIGMNSNTSDFMECTFMGTGLRILSGTNANPVRDWEVTVDGVTQPNVQSGNSAAIIGRNVAPNIIVPIVSGLPFGLHTVRVAIGNTGSMQLQGVQFINDASILQIPPGELFSNGLKYSNPSLQSLDPLTDFFGSPAVGVRGGRVTAYIEPNGTVGKAFRPTDPQRALTLTDHSNEEIAYELNYGAFGSDRPDDFTTLSTTNSNRAYTLDDGTTTLMGIGVVLSGTPDGINVQSNNSSFIVFTFVGTGLDVKLSTSGAGTNSNADAYQWFVDGVLVGNHEQTSPEGTQLTKKIVSGLPYGTHTVKFQRNTADVWTPNITDFIVYQPKRPDLPENAVALLDYMLMADFDPSTATTNSDAAGQGLVLENPLGVIAQMNPRGFDYSGTPVFVDSVVGAYRSGYRFDIDTADVWRYTFVGTGFHLQLGSTGGGNSQIAIFVDEVLDDSGVVEFGGSNLGGGTYQKDNTNTSRISFTGLPYGEHTVRVDGLSGFTFHNGIDIITPVHFSDARRFSSTGPQLPLPPTKSVDRLDLGSAKAWIKFDGITNAIDKSYNVAALVDVAVGQWRIFFERPFKDGNWVAVTGITDSGSGGGLAFNNSERLQTAHSANVVARPFQSPFSPADRSVLYVAFFGELADE